MISSGVHKSLLLNWSFVRAMVNFLCIAKPAHRYHQPTRFVHSTLHILPYRPHMPPLRASINAEPPCRASSSSAALILENGTARTQESCDVGVPLGLTALKNGYWNKPSLSGPKDSKRQFHVHRYMPPRTVTGPAAAAPERRSRFRRAVCEKAKREAMLNDDDLTIIPRLDEVLGRMADSSRYVGGVALRTNYKFPGSPSFVPCLYGGATLGFSDLRAVFLGAVVE